MKFLERWFVIVNNWLNIKTIKAQLRFWGVMLVLFPSICLMLVLTGSGLNPFFSQMHISMIAFLILLVVSLPLTMVLATSLESPLKQLIAGAAAVRAGDYSYRINQDLIENSVNEIRDLCKLFNYMAENIDTKTETLYFANKALTEARDAALEASVAKSQFLANMSHEIRTPLNAILGMGELLAETQLTPEQAKYVHTAVAAGENLLNLINDILDLSKVEAGQIPLEKAQFALPEVIEKACELLSLKAHVKGIALNHYLAPGTPVSLIGDPVRLRQILINLLDNAVKFTDTGEVALEIRQTGRREGGIVELLFMVRDTGIGIPQDMLEHIFERFTQVDSSSTRRHGGTGLGLAISKHLTGLMGGRIWVESTQGAGSRFYFTALFGRGDDHYLPVSAADGRPAQTGPAAAAPPSSAPAGQQAFHILLVEDSADNRLLVEAFLKKTLYKLDMAENGEIAVEKFRTNRYDLILMDMQMPVMDGYQATQTIREWERRHGLAHTPVVALTAYAQPEDTARMRDFGCDAQLTKPIKKKVLLQAIEQFARGAAKRKKEAVTIDSDLKELIPGFLHKRQEDIQAIRTAADAGDYESIRIIGHTLKGIGGGYGFERVTMLGAAIEQAAKSHDSHKIRELALQLQEYLELIEIRYE